MVGSVMKGLQAQHVIGDIKHYALNDQESGRNAVNVNIDKRAARESDLLAFEIGLEKSNAVAVMCSYNRVNGDYACENKYLLKDVLKKDWNFKGFVLSDWGGTHSTEKASAAGLDHEEPGWFFYSDELKKAVESGKVPQAEVDDHVHRVLWAMFSAGVVDDPAQKSVPDIMGGLEVTQKIAEQSTVLLKNENSQLPLNASKVHSIAVIGPHADVGMISGGGSAQVDPPGGNAIMPPGKGQTHWLEQIWFPTSPLKTIKARAPSANVQFDSGSDPAAAAALAKSSDVAIVYAYQWESEADLPHRTVVQPPKESIPNYMSPNVWKQIAEGLAPFQVSYDEGVKVGYKWYDAEKKTVQFPFGYGLSYTTYAYSGLKVTAGKNHSVTFTVKNTGDRDGAEVAEV